MLATVYQLVRLLNNILISYSLTVFRKVTEGKGIDLIHEGEITNGPLNGIETSKLGEYQMDKTVYLVRHCKAAGQELQAELTEQGKEQAIELRHFFKERNIKQIISSPFTRAIQSIQPTADILDLEVEIDRRLAEHKLISKNLKDWLERLEESIREKDLKMAGGESSSEVAKRGMEVLEAATDGTVLVTHRNTMGLLLMQIDGMKGLKEWTGLSHPDVYEVKVQKDTYFVRRIWG